MGRGCSARCISPLSVVREFEANAIDIRMRATRRMDQMRQEQKDTVGLAKAASRTESGLKNNPLATLADTGGAAFCSAEDKALRIARRMTGSGKVRIRK
jgi:hypothetical protein